MALILFGALVLGIGIGCVAVDAGQVLMAAACFEVPP